MGEVATDADAYGNRFVGQFTTSPRSEKIRVLITVKGDFQIHTSRAIVDIPRELAVPLADTLIDLVERADRGHKPCSDG